MPTVSVVVPTYNCSEYIGACLDSILNQTFADLEIIVVDDGSTDDTKYVVSSFSDSRLTYLRQKNSGGPARPRNIGVARATGDFIFAFDADDILMPEFIGHCVELLTLHPELGLVFGNFDRIDAAGKITDSSCLDDYSFLQRCESVAISETTRIIASEAAYAALLHGDYIGRGVLYSREVFDAVGGYDESLTNGQDRDFYFRVCSRYSVGYVNTIGHQFRSHGMSISQRTDVGTAMNRMRILERQLVRDLGPRERKIAVSQLAKLQYAVGRAYKKKGRRDLARRYFRISLANSWESVTLMSYAGTFLSEKIEMRIKSLCQRLGLGTNS